MLKLDKRDLEILSILQNEGRITKSALAERVSLSVTPCWERVNRLEKAGLISGYGASIDLTPLGPATIVFMQAEIQSHRSADFESFEQGLRNIDEVIECWAVGGGFDYLVKFMVRNIDHYQRLVDQILDRDLGLRRYYTYIVTGLVFQRQRWPLASILEPPTDR